ncbi:glycosyltransferase [Actinoplanes sp. NPDC049599]|uniref:glycosyltransferase family 2 protein n=1 Tax=Actinoplanes sp. NPDC049599 TaxID=3363903 RepID=UPI0037BDE3CA
MSAADYAPQPPTEDEKYLYYGRQGRWIFCVFLLAFAGVMFGLARLAANSMWTSLLYELIALQIVAVFISLLSSTRPRRGSRAQHDSRVAAYRPAVYPSVDVFLPSAGEPLTLLDNTFRHVRALEWPGRRTVYVLDDSGRADVAALARRHRFVYLSRPDRGVLRKAGNLRYGFAHSRGDLIHVFDADFAPRPDMTRELAPYFGDPSIGIVQSPQFFDVQQDHFNWLQRSAGATQEMFYRWIQPARDAVDAAICVGTNAMYRRTALRAAGGFAQIGHSEDVHTGVNLAKVGFRTRYVPVNLAKGICPDNFDGFVNQQYRWCTGSMSLLADKGFHTSALSRKQKLCFWTGFLYYITTALAAFAGPLPGLLMLWCFPAQIRPMNYLPMIGTIFVWSTLMPRVTAYRWSPMVVRVQLLIGFCHAVALIDFLRGRSAAWVPTGAAGHTPTARRVLRLLRVWLITTQLLTWAGIVVGVLTYGIGLFWASLLFAGPMLYFVVPLLLGTGCTPRRRPAPRRLAGPVAATPGSASYASTSL